MLRGYFLCLGMLKIFSYKFMVLASSLYTIGTCESFCKNTLLSDSGGHTYVLFSVFPPKDLKLVMVLNCNTGKMQEFISYSFSYYIGFK